MIPMFALPPMDLSDAYTRPPLYRVVQDESLAGLPPRERDINDFLPRTVDVRVKLAFDGVGNGPFSILGALIGWNELAIGVDVGLVGREDITVALGGEFYMASPVLFFVVSELIFDLLAPSAQLDWSASEIGFLARASIHYNALKTVSLYGAGLIGPNTYGFRARVTDSDGDIIRAQFRTTGVRLGIAGGMSHAWDNGWTLSGELRYLISPRVRRALEIDLIDADGDVVGTLNTVGYQRGPKGFSWQLMVGKRF